MLLVVYLCLALSLALVTLYTWLNPILKVGAARGVDCDVVNNPIKTRFVWVCITTIIFPLICWVFISSERSLMFYTSLEAVLLKD